MAERPGLKEYVKSNFVKMGNGPTAWFASTACAKQEVFGAYTQSLHKDPIVAETEEEETTTEKEETEEKDTSAE